MWRRKHCRIPFQEYLDSWPDDTSHDHTLSGKRVLPVQNGHAEGCVVYMFYKMKSRSVVQGTALESKVTVAAMKKICDGIEIHAEDPEYGWSPQQIARLPYMQEAEG